MKKLTLKRISFNLNITFGALLGEDGIPICLTLEKPWLNNQREISCIPKDKYKLVKYSSSKYPNVYEILDVPDRSNILIHVGNTLEDTLGCILTGSSFGKLGNYFAVLSSRLALNKLKDYLGDDNEAEINII